MIELNFPSLCNTLQSYDGPVWIIISSTNHITNSSHSQWISTLHSLSFEISSLACVIWESNIISESAESQHILHSCLTSSFPHIIGISTESLPASISHSTDLLGHLQLSPELLASSDLITHVFDIDVLSSICGVICIGASSLTQAWAAAALQRGCPLRCVDMDIEQAGAAAFYSWASELGLLSTAASSTAAAAPSTSCSVPAAPVRTSTADEGWVLTMHQPWASLLVHGIKRAEGRSWASGVRGRVYIHAGHKQPEPETMAAVKAQYAAIYEEQGITEGVWPSFFPTGCIIGSVTIVGCVPSEAFHAPSAPIPAHIQHESEAACVYLCEDACILSQRLPCDGAPKFWHMPGAMHAQAKELLAPGTRPAGYAPHRFARAWIREHDIDTSR